MEWFIPSFISPKYFSREGKLCTKRIGSKTTAVLGEEVV